MSTERSDQSWKADRQRVSKKQRYELQYILDHKCKNYITMEQLIEVFDSIDDGAVMRYQLMEALEAKGYIHHDPTDGHEPGSPGHENDTPSDEPEAPITENE